MMSDENITDDAEPFGGREGRIVPGEGITLTAEQVKARNQRNLAIGLSLLAFVVLVFVVSFIQISQNIAQAAAG